MEFLFLCINQENTASVYKQFLAETLPGDFGDSEDPDELDVDLSEIDLLLSCSPGFGTNMTEIQLSSESREVSLGILESLLESDSLLSLFCPESSKISTQHLLTVGDKDVNEEESPPTFSIDCFCLGLLGDHIPFLKVLDSLS